MRIGFDNDKYISMQSEHIKERISKFDNKLYLELGGKLFDDYHAARVLPGFQPDSKIKMLRQLSDSAEIVIAVSAVDIEKNIDTGRQYLLNGLTRSAIVITKNFCVFEERISANHFFKFIMINKEIMFTVDYTRTRLACGV